MLRRATPALPLEALARPGFAQQPALLCRRPGATIRDLGMTAER